jgi:hypothetical protein
MVEKRESKQILARVETRINIRVYRYKGLTMNREQP